jgi:FkbM family methyltransferase
MRVIHFAEFAPHRCGLYHTTKDLIKAEKGVGIDAHFVDIDSETGDPSTPGKKDGRLVTSNIRVADDADILVRHNSIPNDLENSGIPLAHAIHGRPESSFVLDEKGVVPAVESFYNKGRDCRYKAFFTFWPEHIYFWSRIIPPSKLFLVPAMVDLMEWRPGGEKFDFGMHNGNPNILIADIWREDITPFNEIMAVAKWIKTKCPTAKLHLTAAPMGKGSMIFWHALGREKILGYVMGLQANIKELYEAADVVVTPHRIMTRIRRESFATGTPVINADELDAWYEGYKISPERMSAAARRIAEKTLNLRQAGLAAKRIFEKILNNKPNKRKVFLDIGGHLGESVRRFYREVEDARHYEICTFEPVPSCFKQLKQNLSRMKNVTAFEKMVTNDGGEERDLFVGSVNDHEGSTSLLNKITGNVDYTKPIRVKTVGIKNFLTRAKADCVILKMNIEGGEYELMDHIIKDDLMPCFNQIYVQTHKHKIDGDPTSYIELEQNFRKEAEKHNVQLFMQEKGMARFQCEGVSL